MQRNSDDCGDDASAQGPGEPDGEEGFEAK